MHALSLESRKDAFRSIWNDFVVPGENVRVRQRTRERRRLESRN
jgi:hypothetical protein